MGGPPYEYTFSMSFEILIRSGLEETRKRRRRIEGERSPYAFSLRKG